MPPECCIESAVIAKVRLLGDDTIHGWRPLHEEGGIKDWAGFGHEGWACRLSHP